jgi:hypothetical protein
MLAEVVSFVVFVVKSRKRTPRLASTKISSDYSVIVTLPLSLLSLLDAAAECRRNQSHVATARYKKG